MAKAAKTNRKTGGRKAAKPAANKAGKTATKKAAAKRAPKKTAKKAVKKAAKKAGPQKPPALTKASRSAVFANLASHSNTHGKAPVCYQQLASGSWMICFLQSDGSYDDCEAYTGPIHKPACG